MAASLATSDLHVLVVSPHTEQLHHVRRQATQARNCSFLVVNAMAALEPTECLHTHRLNPTTDETLLQRLVHHKLCAKDGERIFCVQIGPALQEPTRCLACFRVELGLAHADRFDVLHKGSAPDAILSQITLPTSCNAMAFRWTCLRRVPPDSTSSLMKTHHKFKFAHISRTVAVGSTNCCCGAFTNSGVCRLILCTHFLVPLA